MRTGLTILLAMLVGGCGGGAPAPPSPAQPMRIVSLDYCADQYALELLPRGRILALSSDATRDFSYLRQQATGIRQVPPRAEDVLVLKPDLVIRSYGGGPGIETLLKRAGVPVLQLGYAEDFDGIRRVLADTARALGEDARAASVIADFDARLARLKQAGNRGTALYVTPGGVTSGPGTLIDQMLTRAGYRNFETEAGWRALPLERLAYARPDRIVAARFGPAGANTDLWSAARHPIVRARLSDADIVRIDGAMTACGGWFLLDAVEAIAKAPTR